MMTVVITFALPWTAPAQNDIVLRFKIESIQYSILTVKKTNHLQFALQLLKQTGGKFGRITMVTQLQTEMLKG